MGRDTFGFESTTDEVLEGIDLEGKSVLITGGTAGLGAETARALASKGANVTITARDLEKAKAVVDSIKEKTGKTVEVEQLNLSNLASIRSFAENFLKTHESLNILINNAGVMAAPYSETDDGFELQFGSNHIGHFLMTNLIMPALLKGAPARVVILSSAGHRIGPVLFDDVGFKKTEYEKWAAYGQSKTANLLFAVGLEKRLAAKGIHAYALHPGAIITELQRHMRRADFEEFAERAKREGRAPTKLKSVEAGAATSCFAATAPELEGKGGLYLEDCQVSSINDDPQSNTGIRTYAIDPENAEKLWSISEELVGQKFAY